MKRILSRLLILCMIVTLYIPQMATASTEDNNNLALWVAVTIAFGIAIMGGAGYARKEG